jgi:transcriptional regulator with XRE-family HTH domain
MKNSTLENFGHCVRELRLQQKMSQEELAFKAGLHRTYIGMIERAEKNITLLNIQKIANALSVEITNLLYVQDKSK